MKSKPQKRRPDHHTGLSPKMDVKRRVGAQKGEGRVSGLCYLANATSYKNRKKEELRLSARKTKSRLAQNGQCERRRRDRKPPNKGVHLGFSKNSSFQETREHNVTSAKHIQVCALATFLFSHLSSVRKTYLIRKQTKTVIPRHQPTWLP